MVVNSSNLSRNQNRLPMSYPDFRDFKAESKSFEQVEVGNALHILIRDGTLSEREAAAELARQARLRGFFPPVVLVGGEQRQPLHRHPLPTGAQLGRQALLAITAEREGLHVSLTRLVSFGPPLEELEGLVGACAEVDAAFLGASRPGAALGEVFAVGERAYAEQGFEGEWRRHHQGGLTGYRGREVFGTPGEPAVIAAAGAVAWNPSIAGGAKSEDTFLIGDHGLEQLTIAPKSPWPVTAGDIPRTGILVVD